MAPVGWVGLGRWPQGPGVVARSTQVAEFWVLAFWAVSVLAEGQRKTTPFDSRLPQWPELFQGTLGGCSFQGYPLQKSGST